MYKVSVFTQLTEVERDKIEVLLQQGLSRRAIGRVLQRPASTVSREIARNASAKGQGSYSASVAQQKAQRRHSDKTQRKVFDEAMKHFIEVHLREQRLSPELISALGKQQQGRFVSPEWIYQWLWKMKRSQRKEDRRYRHLYKYLKIGSKRRSRGRKHTKRGNILERTWIDQRPRAVDQRKRRGDLEADIILGKNRQPGLLVALDRKTRKIWIEKLSTKAAPHVTSKLKTICRKASVVKTLTLDNDQSFAQHYQLQKAGIQTFFTHPYSAQEKESVENRIGIIRQFFNKKTDFTKISWAQVKKVERLVNQRPLRMFHYKTPEQMYEKYRPSQ